MTWWEKIKTCIKSMVKSGVVTHYAFDGYTIEIRRNCKNKYQATILIFNERRIIDTDCEYETITETLECAENMMKWWMKTDILAKST